MDNCSKEPENTSKITETFQETEPFCQVEMDNCSKDPENNKKRFQVPEPFRQVEMENCSKKPDNTAQRIEASPEPEMLRYVATNNCSENASSISLLEETLEKLRTEFISDFDGTHLDEFWKKLFFKIESAFWKYNDEYRGMGLYLPYYTLGQFAAEMFSIHEPLKEYKNIAVDLTEQFLAYKRTIPTSGAIILNPAMTKVLIVRGHGKFSRWAFPKGKVEEGETDLSAAIREVKEEIGFDITKYVEAHSQLVTMYKGKRIVHFFATKVPESIPFRTLVRKEILAIRWVNIDDLPDSPEDAATPKKCTLQRSGEDRYTETQYVSFGRYGLAKYSKDIRAFVQSRRKKLCRLVRHEVDVAPLNSRCLQWRSKEEIPVGRSDLSWWRR